MKVLRILMLLALSSRWVPAAQTVFDATSPYHHIRVVDDRGFRVLSFDGSLETRMSLADPGLGHFEYTEYFQLPILWNPGMTNALMIGLGGASTQRAYQRYLPQVAIETAELDAVVVQAAKSFFYFRESASNKVTVMDGRVFLRRSQKLYDAVILDAYVKSRYGSFIPHHLATREFFKIVDEHLTPDGVLAYNVIGTLQGWRADILGAMYRTLREVFPQVYLFPATDSLNVVLIATKSKEKLTPIAALNKAAGLIRAKSVTHPRFQARVRALRTEPPASFLRSPVLTDDFAPVDGLLRGKN